MAGSEGVRFRVGGAGGGADADLDLDLDQNEGQDESKKEREIENDTHTHTPSSGGWRGYGGDGGLIVFDDSYEHEVWHRGTEDRFVLLVVLPHPDASY